MPNYQDSKIYTIRTTLDSTLIYVGATAQGLNHRFSKHKSPTSNCISKEIIKLGRNEAYIELYENYPCKNKEELNRKKGQIIRKLDCINKRIAGRTQQEWREENKEKIKENKKEWEEKNKEKRQKQKKEYREQNKEQNAKRNKKYREENKEKIKLKYQYNKVYNFIYS